jgi:hypothetical protein
MALATTSNITILSSQLFVRTLCQVKEEEKYRNQPLPPTHTIFTFHQLQNKTHREYLRMRYL